ncbi:HTH-type transcriptional regulator ImmR [Lachnospiraceae bacterium]|nr:HTH-type transcriptional regulator ImmR [Lachnospiraceae bacterium]
MFSNRLNETRKAKGFTAQNMADQLGLTLRSYQFYESGKRSPSLDTLVKIANILDVSIDYLLCRDDFLQSRGVSFDGHLIDPPRNPIK